MSGVRMMRLGFVSLLLLPREQSETMLIAYEEVFRATYLCAFCNPCMADCVRLSQPPVWSTGQTSGSEIEHAPGGRRCCCYGPQRAAGLRAYSGRLRHTGRSKTAEDQRVQLP